MIKRVLSIVLSTILLISTLCIVGCAPSSFTVSFDLDGGELISGDNTPLNQTISNASEIVLPRVRKDGYDFYGWDKVISKIKRSTTVKAVWTTLGRFTITFNPNGGEWNGTDRQEFSITSYEQLQTLTPPEYKKTGYTLTWDKIITEITEDTTVNAVWVPNTYNVSFIKGDGEDWTGQSESKQVVYGEDIIDLPTPTKEGFKIGRWEVEDKVGLREYDGLEVFNGQPWLVAKDVSLKPVWVNLINVVNYTLNGGSFDSGAGRYYFSSEDEFYLNAPKKTGHVFLGWTGEGYEEPTVLVKIEVGTEKDLHFTANWEAEKYTIALDTDGGELATRNVVVTYGEAVPNLPIPEKEGYIFDYWYYENYIFKANQDNGTWNIGSAVTLKAKYLRIYTVKIILKYEFSTISGSGYPIKHEVKYTYNGSTKELEGVVIVGKPIAQVVKQFDQSLFLVVANGVSGRVDYEFVDWVYKIGNTEYVLTDLSLANENVADSDGVIKIYPKSRYLFLGPF